ncbi:MAG TPA: DUF3667 domain-containing protein, partial [Gemmatirosa sp.]
MTCDHSADTPYCPHCGERRAADHAYTLAAIVAELWDHLAPADGKALRSLWALVRRPGALTTAYMRGSRQPYLSPLRLFLLVNAAYFAYASLLNQHFLTTPLANHLGFGFYSATASAMVNARIAARGVTLAAYAAKFDAVGDTQAKALVAAIVPMFAAVTALVELRRPRPVLHHVTFGFHTIAALLCLFMGPYTVIALPLEVAIRSGRVGLGSLNPDLVIATPMLVILWAWLWFGLRRAYGDGPWRGAVKAAVVAGSFGLILGAYRALLFFTT